MNHWTTSNSHPHPEVLRSSLEGGLQIQLREVEGSFEASASLRHLRMRSRLGGDETGPDDHSETSMP